MIEIDAQLTSSMLVLGTLTPPFLVFSDGFNHFDRSISHLDMILVFVYSLLVSKDSRPI